MSIINGDHNANTLTGTDAPAGNDALGSAGDDVINGKGGDDIENGLSGNDTLRGGGGADILRGGAGNDLLDGGSGRDTADYSDTTQGVNASLWTGVATGAEIGTDKLVGIENLTGGTGDDHLRGSAGNNTVIGGDGDDQVLGRSGNDHVYGGNGMDLVVGARGSDMLYGQDGNDTLLGGWGVDHLDGGTGDDHLTGGKGQDFLTGGSGADTFVYNNFKQSLPGASNRDIITDFSESDGDKIQLTRIDERVGHKHEAPLHLAGDAFTHTAGELIQYIDSNHNTIIAGDLNGDGVADFEIQLHGVHTLTASDFIF